MYGAIVGHINTLKSVWSAAHRKRDREIARLILVVVHSLQNALIIHVELYIYWMLIRLANIYNSNMLPAISFIYIFHIFFFFAKYIQYMYCMEHTLLDAICEQSGQRKKENFRIKRMYLVCCVQHNPFNMCVSYVFWIVFSSCELGIESNYVWYVVSVYDIKISSASLCHVVPVKMCTL